MYLWLFKIKIGCLAICASRCQSRSFRPISSQIWSIHGQTGFWPDSNANGDTEPFIECCDRFLLFSIDTNTVKLKIGFDDYKMISGAKARLYYQIGHWVIEGSVIANNDAGDDGGGTYSDGSTIVINDSDITDNSADSYGGGIYSAYLFLPCCTRSSRVGGVAGRSLFMGDKFKLKASGQGGCRRWLEEKRFGCSGGCWKRSNNQLHFGFSSSFNNAQIPILGCSQITHRVSSQSFLMSHLEMIQTSSGLWVPVDGNNFLGRWWLGWLRLQVELPWLPIPPSGVGSFWRGLYWFFGFGSRSHPLTQWLVQSEFYTISPTLKVPPWHTIELLNLSPMTDRWLYQCSTHELYQIRLNSYS